MVVKSLQSVTVTPVTPVAPVRAAAREGLARFGGVSRRAAPALVERRTVVSPALGALRLIATDEALVAIYFAEHRRPRRFEARVLDPGARHAVLDAACAELEEYVRGERAEFTVRRAPLGTQFQRSVWEALSAIPFGETRSYAELARAIGRPRAVRAVGAANALNPLSIVVPCHRVVGKDGTLVGYAGGVERKAWLLAHERLRAPAMAYDRVPCDPQQQRRPQLDHGEERRRSP